MRPSFLGLVFTGILIGISIISIIINSDNIKGVHFIYIPLLLAVAVSGHSILHAHEEIYYNFNPLSGNWKITDKIQK